MDTEKGMRRWVCQGCVDRSLTENTSLDTSEGLREIIEDGISVMEARDHAVYIYTVERRVATYISSCNCHTQARKIA